MSAAALPSDAPTSRMAGSARVRFGVRDGKTRLIDLYQSAPLRVLFPRTARGEIETAALASTSGGVVGGDRLDYALSVERGARARFMAQAAEKIYRSIDGDARINLSLTVEDGGWGEYLPQETILFDGARLARRTVLNLSGDGGALAGEILAFGRKARGEAFSHGKLREAWEVYRNGRLVWADALILEDDIAGLLQRPSAFGGAHYAASLLLVANDAEARLSSVRSALPERASATIVNSVLLVRWLSSDVIGLRASFAQIWGMLGADPASQRDAMPRLWVI